MRAGGRLDHFDDDPTPATWGSAVVRVRPWAGEVVPRRSAGTRAALTAATVAVAAAAVAGCLMVAVPCGLYAVVGVWFCDASAAEAAGTAVAASAVGAVIAVPVLLGHQRLARRARLRRPWN